MNLIYELTLFLLALLALPPFLFALIVKKKYRKSFKSRLGIGFPQIKKGSRPLIWIHANSLGETKAIAPLVKRLKNHESNPLLLLTSITETGFEEGKKSLPEVDCRAYLPFDFWFIVAPIVRRIKPDLVLISETDYWYNFLREAKKSGAKLVTINGKISEKSFGRFRTFHFFSKALFSLMDRFCLQSELYADRFRALKIPGEKITVTGNIKLDAPTELIDPEWKKRIGVEEGDLILTLGSTHEPEEKILLSSLKPLWEKFPHLKVLIVPRHPERFDRVANLIALENQPWGRLSLKGNLGDKRILLVDAMGLLKQCYGVSTLAFVAGSLTSKVGGHNVVEPCFYGVPVLFGPFMHSQKEFQEMVLSSGAGLQVEEKEITAVIEDLLRDKEKRERLGTAGKKLVAEVKGSCERSWQSLLPFLDSFPKKGAI